MPWSDAAATRMFDATFVGDLFVHLHTSYPPTTGNVVTGPGYAGVPYTGAFTSASVGALRRRLIAVPINMPTPGGAWSRIVSAGVWDRLNIAPNVADPPGLILAVSLPSPIDADLNGSFSFPVGMLFDEIEVAA